MRRTRRTRRLRLLLGVAFAGVCLLLVELALRIAGVGAAYRPDAIGAWRMAANLRDHESKGPRDGHSFLLTTNADGLRTRLPRERGAARRVAVMGDSTVFGWGVDDGASIADGIQSAFDPAVVEVLNAGQPGYSTTQAAWLYGEVVAGYAPDLVVLFLPQHDWNRVLVSDREYLRGGDGAVAMLRVLLARESRTYTALRSGLFAYADEAFLLPDRRTAEPRVPRVSDAEREENVLAVRDELATRGGRLMVGFLPFAGDIEGMPGDSRQGLAWARRMSEAYGIGLVDVRACCTGGAGLVLADDPGHLSAEGNRRAGLAIAEAIRGAVAP